MKTWITYPAAVIFALAASFLLQDWQPYVTILEIVVPWARQLGMFVLFPIVFVLFTSAVASLRRYKDSFIIFSSTIFWGMFTSLLLSFVGMGLAMINPFRYTGLTPVASSSIQFFDFTTMPSLLLAENAFSQFTRSSITLLAVIVLAFVFGISLRPDREVLRPAYVVMNSFAEAMLRLARIMTVFGALLVLFIGAQWFREFPVEVLFSSNLMYILSMVVLMLAALLIILPLFYGVCTKFRGGNPYSMLLGALGAVFASAFSGSLLFGTTAILALSQKNCGVRKRVGGIVTPLLGILGRGGSAMMGTFLVITVLHSTSLTLSLQTMVFIALFSALFSLISSFTPGMEILFISVLVLQGLQADTSLLFSSGIIILMPALHLTALVVDTMVNVYGAAFGSRIVSPDDSVAIGEMM